MSEVNYEKFEKDIRKTVHIAKIMYRKLNSKKNEREDDTSNGSSIPSNRVIDSIIML